MPYSRRPDCIQQGQDTEKHWCTTARSVAISLWDNMIHLLLGAERTDPLQGKPVPRRRLVDPKLPMQDKSIQHDEVNLRLEHKPLTPLQYHCRSHICGYSECFIFPLSASSFRVAGVLPPYCGKKSSQCASLIASRMPPNARSVASFADNVVDQGVLRVL